VSSDVQVAILSQCMMTGELLEMGKPPSRDLDAQLVDSSGVSGLIVHVNDVPKWEEALRGRRSIQLFGARSVIDVLILGLEGY
jgi:hypothetical protein